jgi:hypothetical protein
MDAGDTPGIDVKVIVSAGRILLRLVRLLEVGADWVRLFDKRLCDEIVSLNSDTLPEFVQAQLPKLGQYDLFRLGFGDEIPAEERLRKFKCDGITEHQLKEILVRSLCVIGREIQLDYWGCYAEVFSKDPPDSIPDTALFPYKTETLFLLLRSEHLDRMLTSLQAHRRDVWVMKESDILRLRSWRDRCSGDSNMMVAYFFDF